MRGIEFDPGAARKRPLISKGNELTIPGDVILDLLQAVLAKGSLFRFRAHGMSMLPFIRDNDFLTIAPPGSVKPGIGRVVAYTNPGCGSLIVHRVIRCDGNTFLIAGDNTLSRFHDRVDRQAILGCVIRVERNGRRVFVGLGFERYLIALFSRCSLLARVNYYHMRFKNRS